MNIIFPVQRFCRTEREVAKGKVSSPSSFSPSYCLLLLIIITIMDIMIVIMIIMMIIIMIKVAGWELDDPQYLAVCDNNRVFFECLLEQVGVII